MKMGKIYFFLELSLRSQCAIGAYDPTPSDTLRGSGFLLCNVDEIARWVSKNNQSRNASLHMSVFSIKYDLVLFDCIICVYFIFISASSRFFKLC